MRGSVSAVVLVLLLVLAGISLGLLTYFSNNLKDSRNEARLENEQRGFNIDPSRAVEEKQLDTVSEETPTLEPEKIEIVVTGIPTVNPKVQLRINSYGNVDLGGGFLARLLSAEELNNYIYVEIRLTNNYQSLLGLNTEYIRLRRKGEFVQSPTKFKEIGVNPGETETIKLIYEKFRDYPYEISYVHEVSHIGFPLGEIVGQ